MTEQTKISNGFDEQIKLAESLLKRRRFSQAESICCQLIQINDAHDFPYFLIGLSKCEQGQFKQSIAWFEKASSVNSSCCRTYVFQAKSWMLLNRLDKAKTLILHALKLKSNDAFTNDTMGTVLSRLGLQKQAVSCYQKATELEPNNSNFWFNLGATQRFLGALELARHALEESINCDFRNIQAHALLTEVSKISTTNNHIDRLKELLLLELSSAEKLIVSHALAKELAAIGEYNQSFSILEEAKSERKQDIGYHFEADKRRIECFKSLSYCPQTIETEFDKKPIFVLGMPRSGTTLVERILTGSSQVDSAGELNSLNFSVANNLSQYRLPHLSPGYINKIPDINFNVLRQSYFNSAAPLIRGKGEYVIDKMPLNFMYIELIANAFPESKIVLLHRHPLDVCIGNFKVLFSTQYSLYNYALDIENTANYITAFTSLMKHYKSKLMHRLHVVD
ncbi:MAG: sulfotransferase, partial [Kangiellaceae bacterium]|nr:sulfotransferase [Kangiellaceae bacterium]